MGQGHPILVRGLRLEFVEIVLTELCHLGSNHHLTVTVVFVVGKIFLMIVFGGVEGFKARHLSDNRATPHVRLIERVDGGLGDVLLFIRMEEDGGAILCSNVRALLVQGSGIVDGEEDVEQVLEGDNLIIEGDFNDFGMTV